MKCPECDQEIYEDDETVILDGKEYHKECLPEEDMDDAVRQIE